MGKKALITGGSRGIGAACASALASSGFEVSVNYYKSRDEALNIAEKINGKAIMADVTNKTDVTRMFNEVGVVDLLVCCAGIAQYGLFTDISDDELKRVFDVNVGGVINCCREAIPGMVAVKCGKIITISSIWGIVGASCEAVYSASKAAVIGLTKSLAKELAPSGILVNCVAPGAVDTDMLSNLKSEEITAICDETPLGRLGAPEEIAGLVSYLASDAARFITGQVISPNGGLVI